jgi:Icc-related predicted phosphoesterase
METVEQRINDFSCIKIEGLNFTANDCANLGSQHELWLKEQLSNKTKEPCVVITHFSPAKEFRNKKYPVDYLTAYFCNDQLDLIKKYEPDMWIFGHTHFNVDESYLNTRVVSNQHGYGKECSDYDPNFSIVL